MSLLAQERQTYTELLETVGEYGDFSPGLRYLPVFQSLVTSHRPASVLDAGCCRGTTGVALQADGFDVTLLDLTDAGLTDAAKALPFHEASIWHDLRPLGTFDYTFCCDVLEHLDPAFTMLAVEQMLRVSAVGLFLGIALTPDLYGMWAGRPLHQTVQPYMWWRDHLREVSDLYDARDLHQTATFFLRAR